MSLVAGRAHRPGNPIPAQNSRSIGIPPRTTIRLSCRRLVHLQKLDTLLEGKYEILDRLREGGMGTIYRVRHRLLDEVRVIKVMRPHAVADKDLKRRFFEEARTATRLKHPNICTILDFALDDEGTAYLVMEFIDGVNLSELLGVKGPPGIALALEIAHQTLLALGYLYRRNVVHRDIAPDNIMVS